MTIAKNGMVEIHGAAVPVHLPKHLDGMDIIEIEMESLDVTREAIEGWNNYRWNGGKNYDETTVELEYNAPAVLADMILYHTDGKVNRVLDLGCGTGLLGERLIANGMVIDGIDFSTNQLRKARERGYRELRCADLRQTNPERILDSGEKYDCIASTGVFGDFVQPFWFLPYLRFLKDDGFIGLAGLNRGYKGIEELLETIGFDVKDSKREVAHKTLDGRKMEYFYIVAHLGK